MFIGGAGWKKQSIGNFGFEDSLLSKWNTVTSTAMSCKKWRGFRSAHATPKCVENMVNVMKKSNCSVTSSYEKNRRDRYDSKLDFSSTRSSTSAHPTNDLHLTWTRNKKEKDEEPARERLFFIKTQRHESKWGSQMWKHRQQVSVIRKNCEIPVSLLSNFKIAYRGTRKIAANPATPASSIRLRRIQEASFLHQNAVPRFTNQLWSIRNVLANNQKARGIGGTCSGDFRWSSFRWCGDVISAEVIFGGVEIRCLQKKLMLIHLQQKSLHYFWGAYVDNQYES